MTAHSSAILLRGALEGHLRAMSGSAPNLKILHIRLMKNAGLAGLNVSSYNGRQSAAECQGFCTGAP